jgi:hypothetical protein
VARRSNIERVSVGDARHLELLRRWSRTLDYAFRIPGTSIRFGLDPILGLVPGLGDLITPLFSVFLILHANRVGAPRVVQLRMLLNALIDAAAGAVPIVGDLVDLAWKANARNLTLLERHAGAPAPARTGDWVFVTVVLALLAAAAAAPIAIAFWILATWKP